MKILIALTYYRPHYSGLTIYAERLARALAANGHQVTVLTSQYDRKLPRREIKDGVRVIRLPVWMRISKGVLMPAMPLWAWKLVRQADVVNLHVPQLDAALIGVIAKLQGKPIVLTYHCDLRLPRGWIHALANRVSTLANHITVGTSNVVVTNTRDYAQHSAFLRHYLDKLKVVPPPVTLAEVNAEELQNFRQEFGIQAGQPVIGMAARLATEKGVEYLVQALPRVLEKFPDTRVLFVGQYEHVIGEEAYARKLAPLIEQLGGHWRFLGVLPPRAFTAFLSIADVTVLPSINSTESFGMVQVESMTCGTAVIATDIPGVRQPVAWTGMGKIIPAANADALAQAIIEVISHPQDYSGDSRAIAEHFSPDRVAAAYEAIFDGCIDPGLEEQDAGFSSQETP